MEIRQTATGWELVDDTGTVVQSGTLQALVAAVEQPDEMHWEGVITLEGATTGDGRGADHGAWEWETPFPLRWQREGGTHDEAVTIGIVWEVERRDDGSIFGRGTFDLASDEGREAARHVSEGLTNDVSIEPDSVDVELRALAEVVEKWDEQMEQMIEGEYEAPERETDDEGRVILDEFRHDDILEIVTSGRIRTLGLVTTAAYDEARIDLLADLDTLMAADPDDAQVASLTAGGSPARPPSAWFDDPQLDGPTALTVTDDGRIYGHLATWDTCHIGRDDVCLTPPKSAAGYAYFATGEVQADCEPCAASGGRPVLSVPTGTITLGTGHAELTARPADAAAHYDNTGTAVADVAAGEDAHGIWVAGALRPGVSDEQVRALRGSSLSGDWRRIGGTLELVAALAVNVPGFPIPRTVAASAAPRARAHVEAGDTVALVASGTVPQTTEPRREAPAQVEIPEDFRRDLRLLTRALGPAYARTLRDDVHGHGAPKDPNARRRFRLRQDVHGR